ncbi:glutamate racemase [Acetobacter oeni]|nr:aspartate/glutamate racemase family protein [Acetobacter oeni]NHO17520.1 glutamate racemase [Acetobacter oeni]
MGIVGALRTELPGAVIDYLADTAVYPYGEQDDGFLTARIVSLIQDAVIRLDSDVVVVACNTASTLALEALRDVCPVPVVGCVPPIRWAARVSRTRVIGLLATKATVGRPYVASLQAQFAPDCTLIAHGARHLADCAEGVFRGRKADPALIRRELSGLFGHPDGGKIDAVALGCTHYTFLIDAFREVSPVDVVWLDPAVAVARQTAAVLGCAPAIWATEGSGRVWFTAPPHEAAGLESGLRGFGYAAPELWQFPFPAGVPA